MSVNHTNLIQVCILSALTTTNKIATIFSTSLHALPGEQLNFPVSPEWEETAWWVQ